MQNQLYSVGANNYRQLQKRQKNIGQSVLSSGEGNGKLYPAVHAYSHDRAQAQLQQLSDI